MSRFQIVLVLVILTAFVGCSSGQSPVSPGNDPVQVTQDSGYQSSRITWGYWTIRIDPESESIEIIPDREVALHFNVVRLLEIDPCTDCLKISNLSQPLGAFIQCDFQLTHPLPGASNLTGFDVRGVLVTDGDTLFPESNRFMSLDGSNTVLLDPDGCTDLFNPVEFPPGSAQWPILEYTPGKKTFGDDLTGTLNPFMAFCKDKPRRMFAAGATETVTVNLEYSSIPFEFGYIVDASWVKVDGEVVDPVEDFPPEANCLEPYRLEFRMLTELEPVENDTTDVQVEVFDHQGPDTINTVSIECPSLFDGEVMLDYSSQSGDDSWIFEGVITNQSGKASGQYPALIKVTSEESDVNLGELAAYQIADVTVFNSTTLLWAKRAGGVDADMGISVTTLSDNSTVVTGFFDETATFGEGETNETELVSAGWDDIFIARYNPDGTLAWAKRAGGIYFDIGIGITTLSDDSIVITGSFAETVTFGEGETNETILESSDGGDIYLARYNPDGSLVWAISAGGISHDSSSGITALSDNSTVVTGDFWKTITFGLGEANETTFESVDKWGDIFIARYNPDGTLAWAKSANGYSVDSGNAVTALSNDSTVITGSFRQSVTFGKGETNETVLVSDGNSDIFVARYNPDGTLDWAIRSGGFDKDNGNGITTLSGKSIVVTGTFSQSAYFGLYEPNETLLISEGDPDIFVTRYNPDGTLAWAKRAGGSDIDMGYGITTLSDNSTLVTGHFHGSAIFGEDEANETVLVAPDGELAFIARYNSDGTLVFADSEGGPYCCQGTGITALSDDSAVVTGAYLLPATFGAGEPNETVLISEGQIDMFVARFAL